MTTGPVMSRPVEVLLLEDHLALRKGLELLLRREGMRIAGVGARLAEARRLLQHRRHDVVLIDMTLADGKALPLLLEHLARNPSAPVVIHTGESDPRSLDRAARAGARGFVLKASAPSELVAALRRVAEGGTYIDPHLNRLLAFGQSASRRSALSPREREILEKLAEGLTGEQIAAHLVISPETVRTHIRNAMTKLGARTRAHAVAMVVSEGVSSGEQLTYSSARGSVRAT